MVYIVSHPDSTVWHFRRKLELLAKGFHALAGASYEKPAIELTKFHHLKGRDIHDSGSFISLGARLATKLLPIQSR